MDICKKARLVSKRFYDKVVVCGIGGGTGSAINEIFIGHSPLQKWTPLQNLDIIQSWGWEGGM